MVDSRPADEGASIRRRRECLKCGRRFTTYEQIEYEPVIVIKKDGKRQPYSRQKLEGGILRACEKTPVTLSQIEQLVHEIEMELQNRLDREVSTTVIGELVMERLKTLNAVAYVRFASVYREFKDVTTFMDELNSLIRSK